MSTHTYDDLSRALRSLAGRTSPAEANRLLASLCGTTSLREIDPETYGDLIAALDRATSAPHTANDMLLPDGSAIDPAKAFAKWNASGKRAD
jgi:hypothetical protein